MTRVRVVAATVVAVFALFVCLQASVVGAEENKKLYPACGGSEFARTALSGSEVQVFAYPYQSRSVTLDCLAYEVTSIKGGQKDPEKDYCLVEHQTDYAYSLVLRAVYVASNGSSVFRDFSIRDMTGGSLTEMTVRMPQLSRFLIVFRNDGVNERCNLRIRALVSVLPAPALNTSDVVPAVVAIEPRTVYTKDSPRTYVVLDHGSGNTPNRNDVVSLVDYSTGTCANPGTDIVMMDYTSTIPSTVHTPGDVGSYSVRATTLYNPNTYRVCYRAAASSSSVEIAVITAFSGNPAYYEVIEGEDADGRVMVGVKATIKFYGYDLDTRANGDAAKFVWFMDECDSGEPAAGVPLTEDLGPADNYGPNTTYSLWTWTMTKEGSFKVCYRRKATGKWTEVPSIDDVGPGTATDSTVPSEVPDPTDSASNKCPKLSYNPKNPWKKFKSVQVTLTTKDIPDSFFATLSQVLCLPVNMFIVIHSRKTPKGYKNVFLALNCDAAGNEKVCDTTERLNYFAQLSSQVLAENGISEVVGSTSLFAFDDDNVIATVKRSSTALIFFGLCVLAGGGMAVLAVSRYQERRHHFTQFGLEEDDIDDMYDFAAGPDPNAPSGAAARDHYNVPGAPPPPPAHIQNAVIEIED